MRELLFERFSLVCRLRLERRNACAVHKMERAATGQSPRTTAMCGDVFHRRMGGHWMLLSKAVRLQDATM